MGTAILTNLNGMTNPPNGLNEITTGWRFCCISLSGASMAHVIPKDTQYHTNFNQELQRATIFDFPTKISAFAIMRKKGFSESTVTTGSLDNLYKPWPSNPTIDNILDETTYPLNVYFAPRKDNYGKYVYETYTYNARGYRSHYTYQIEISMTSITAITIWNKVENHSMDGHDWGGIATIPGPIGVDLTARPFTKPGGSLYMWYLPA